MVEDWIKPPPAIGTYSPSTGTADPSTLTPPNEGSGVNSPAKPLDMIELRRRALESALELEIQACTGGKPSGDKVVATAQLFEKYILWGGAEKAQ